MSDPAQTNALSQPLAARPEASAPDPSTQRPNPTKSAAPTGVFRTHTDPQDRSAGTPSSMPPAPTKARLDDRRASPAAYATSGVEHSLGDLADRLHPVRSSSPPRPSSR